jgi:sulfotransferase
MLHFVSGLPRSGSTLLMNLLGQNPKHEVTPTSGLIHLFQIVTNSWKQNLEFQAEGLEKVQPKVASAAGHMLTGYHRLALEKEKIVFDKSRGWLQYIEDLDKCLGYEVKVLVTVRDVRSIIASFEKLYRDRGIQYEYPVGEAFFKAQTTMGRAEVLLMPGGVVGSAINRLRDAIQRKPDRLIKVSADQLTKDPLKAMSQIHKRLGLDDFDYKPDNVEQVTHENDMFHGMDLHKIRNKIEPMKADWSILPDELLEILEKQYADINSQEDWKDEEGKIQNSSFKD